MLDRNPISRAGYEKLKSQLDQMENEEMLKINLFNKT